MTSKFTTRIAVLLVVTAAALVAAPAPQQPIPETLYLKTALQFALENNFTLRQARERIKQQEGVEIEVLAQKTPQVALATGYSLNEKEVSRYVPADSKDWTIGLVAKQTVYAGGGIDASLRATRLTREAALLELQGIINDQLLLTRVKFYNVLLNEARVKVQLQNVQLLEEQFKTARNRFDAGASSNFEVLRAEVSLANGHPPLIQAKNDLRLSIEELRQVLGFTTVNSVEAAKLPQFVGMLEVGQDDSIKLVDALNAGRANRPELRRIGKLSDASEEGVKAARAGYRPTLSVYGRYDVNHGYPTGGWSDRRDGFSAGIQGQWNIFDGRATAGKVAQAKSKLNQARLSLEEASLAVDVEVRRAYSSLQEAWELVAATGKVVAQAEEALRLANVRYGAGAAVQLDVLTSQVSLTEARLNQLRAYHGYNVALASLRKAMGQADSFALSN